MSNKLKTVTSPPSSTTTSSTGDAASAQNGTLHVRVVRARNLPRMDFGKRQDPFGTCIGARDGCAWFGKRTLFY